MRSPGRSVVIIERRAQPSTLLAKRLDALPAGQAGLTPAGRVLWPAGSGLSVLTLSGAVCSRYLAPSALEPLLFEGPDLGGCRGGLTSVGTSVRDHAL